MNIAITSGKDEAEFIVRQFKNDNNKLVVINEDTEMCKRISASCGISVFNGEPTKPYSLKDANVTNCDILISLSDSDTDNYVICKMAKQMFNVKKVICIVNNPKNVELFKRLGIDSVISSTYVLYQTIKGETSLDDFVRSMEIEKSKIVMTEIEVLPDFEIEGKMLKECNFPANLNISCILRGDDALIAKGSTCLQAGDKLYMVSESTNQNEIINFIKKRKIEDGKN